MAAYLAIAERLSGDEARGEAFNAGAVSRTRCARWELVCRVAGTDLEPDIRGVGTPRGEINRHYLDTKSRAS